MQRTGTWLLLAGLASSAAPTVADDEPARREGPIVKEFGAVYAVDEPDFPTPTEASWKAVFDVSVAAETEDALNPRIETVARFLNMHAQAGVAPENMQVTLVLHGTAGKDSLRHEAYRARYGVDNPNFALLAALDGAGVEVLLCGQTAKHRGLKRDELAPSVGVALSAMTVLVSRQAAGYALIAF